MSGIGSHKRLAQSQSGMVAIMVTMILMVVISLIVLGFAQVTRRAQRNVLDNQLSTQAFYAAESGVNDAVANLQQKIASGAVVLPQKTTCTNDTNYTFNTNLNANVSYSCVLIDPTPAALYAKPLTSQGAVMLLATSSGDPFRTITFSWTPPPNEVGLPFNCPASAGTFPAWTAATWPCKYGVLRAELTPVDSLSRTTLMDDTRVNFLEPVRAAPGTMTEADNGNTIGANCKDLPTPTCQVVLNINQASTMAAQKLYLRISSLYKEGNLTITATDRANKTVLFSGGQAQISATGKAQDVLRRILVAVPIGGTQSNAPNAAIISGDTICKRFRVTNNSFSKEGFPGANGNTLCDATLSVGTPTNP